RGPDVVATLTAALADPELAVRAVAATGLGQLGEPEVLAAIDPWLRDPDPGPGPGYLRECAAITCVLLGLAATPEPAAGPAPEHPPRGPACPSEHVPGDLSQQTYEAALARISAALHAPAPDLRF